jgi:chromosome partitioning protein
MISIAIVNQKGGVGKTTTAINLSAALADAGKKILLIDLDPQGNATKGLHIHSFDKTIYDIMINNEMSDDAILKTEIRNLRLIPANRKLANAEQELVSNMYRHSILKNSLIDVIGYDYIILDCNPSLGLLTINALAFAKYLLIPLNAGRFAFDGIGALIKTIELVKKGVNTDLQIFGVLLTMVDGRTNLWKSYHEEINITFKNKAFETIIHQNIKIAEAQVEGMPIHKYFKKCTGTKEYKALAKEVIKRSSDING